MKEEPSHFSISNLREKGISRWDGIRNYQARNFMRTMKEGDQAFFYHSSCAQPGIYGLMSICKEAYPDPLAVDPQSEYCDKKALSTGNNPWTSVDVKFEKEFEKPLLLPAIRELPLGECRLTARGNRLSIIPLTIDQMLLLLDELEKINKKE